MTDTPKVNRIRLTSSAGLTDRPLWLFLKFGSGLMVVLAGALLFRWMTLPKPRAAAAPAPLHAAVWRAGPTLSTADWTIGQDKGGGGGAAGGALTARYRLAGTFFSYPSAEEAVSERKAILDDLQTSTQRIVMENDEVEGVRVVSILRDRVVLRGADGDTELWLSFSSQPAAGGAAEGSGEGAGGGGVADNPFGIKQVGDRRWVFDRESLLRYYKELMDEPDRLVQVFDSLKPVREEAGNITGYQLAVQGEAGFFGAAGLRENDVVRSVNSLPMTNRRRAEFFIHEFVANNVNVFVLDVEREGAVQKLVYQIR